MTENRNLELLYQELDYYKDFDVDPENCEKFLSVVDQIVLIKDESSIPVLLRFFDDKTEFGWLMTSLRKSLEYYPPKEYVMGVLESLPFLISCSIIYLDEILNAIFNSDIHRRIFRVHFREVRRDLLEKIFNYMTVESPHHAKLIQEFRDELNHLNKGDR